MDIHIIQEQSLLILDSLSIIHLVKDFSNYYKVKFNEVSIYFVETSKICELHEKFFNDPSTTDCISFPMDDQEEEYRILGDVIVCPETAQEYVKINGGDIYHEVTLYIIHGLLHLIGFDDIEKNDQLQMRKEEAEYLEHLASKKLWIHP